MCSKLSKSLWVCHHKGTHRCMETVKSNRSIYSRNKPISGMIKCYIYTFMIVIIV